MATYFISDLHLGESQTQCFKGFEAFLTNIAEDAQALYILGDFFDAWIGDDDESVIFNDIKKALKTYASKVPTYFMVGNRDFLVGERFARETGLSLIGEEHVINLYGIKALLMHGDSLCTDDIEYLKFRQMVRNPEWQHQVLGLPLAQRRQMAADLRSKSKSLNAIKAEDIMDVNEQTVQLVIEKHQVQTLIHGHTHRPKVHTLSLPNGEQGQRIVLGDWQQTGWYLKATSQQSSAPLLELVEFDLAEVALA